MGDAMAATERAGGWRKTLIAALIGAIVFAIAVVYIDFLAAWGGVFPGAQRPFNFFAVAADAPQGWSKITSVGPDAQIARLGLRAGDVLRYDRPLDSFRNWEQGERIGFRYRHDGVERQASVVLTPTPDGAANQALLRVAGLNAIARLTVLGLGLLLLARRWHDAAARNLGLALIGISVGIPTIPHWLHAPPLQWALLALQSLGYGLRAAIVPAAWHLSRPQATRTAPGWFAVWWTVAMLLSTSTWVATIAKLAVPLAAQPIFLALAYQNLALVLAGAVIARRFGQASGAQRNRIKLVAATIAMFLLQGLLVLIATFLSSLANFVTVRIIADALTVCAAALLAFSMLRHKLFDFGFVVNRTLVFGVVSFVLLACFGLGEKLVDALIPESWRGGSAVIEGIIALGLFLSFHRLHDWIEARIERLLFRAWHDNEAALHGFVERAEHYERRDTLALDAAREFHRFTRTNAALFWRDVSGDFVLLAAAPSWPQSAIDADDRALTQARANRGAVDVTAGGSALAAELVLPVIDHGTLLGFVAVAPKPNGIGYRPDEVAAMTSAAQRIGLDLQAMRARQLAADNATLEAQVSRLSQVLAERGEVEA